MQGALKGLGIRPVIRDAKVKSVSAIESLPAYEPTLLPKENIRRNRAVNLSQQYGFVDFWTFFSLI